MVFSPSGDSLIRILLPEEPPVIQITERSKESSLSAGDLETQNQVQVLPEVEILLDEQDSAWRVCYFCFGTEIVYEGRGVRFERLDYGSLYQCMSMTYVNDMFNHAFNSLFLIPSDANWPL